jgi:hypothetical protein
MNKKQDEFLAARKETGLRIDPNTAEVMWDYVQTLDPYGIDPELPEELQQVGRAYFARAPGSDVWVCFYDLPDATRDALWEMQSRSWRSPQDWICRTTPIKHDADPAEGEVIRELNKVNAHPRIYQCELDGAEELP